MSQVEMHIYNLACKTYVSVEYIYFNYLYLLIRLLHFYNFDISSLTKQPPLDSIEMHKNRRILNVYILQYKLITFGIKYIDEAFMRKLTVSEERKKTLLLLIH
jgi:hypothetical protein